MSDRVLTALVTGEQATVLSMCQRTSFYANWVEGRTRTRDHLETYVVTVWGNERADFLDTARETGVTVEEVIGSGAQEEYLLLVGAPGTGWAEA